MRVALHPHLPPTHPRGLGRNPYAATDYNLQGPYSGPREGDGRNPCRRPQFVERPRWGEGEGEGEQQVGGWVGRRGGGLGGLWRGGEGLCLAFVCVYEEMWGVGGWGWDDSNDVTHSSSTHTAPPHTNKIEAGTPPPPPPASAAGAHPVARPLPRLQCLRPLLLQPPAAHRPRPAPPAHRRHGRPDHAAAGPGAEPEQAA